MKRDMKRQAANYTPNMVPICDTYKNNRGF